MIDFIKIELPQEYSIKLLNHPDLHFTFIAPHKSNKKKSAKKELASSYKKAVDKGIEFQVFDSGRIIIQGSIHKYWNNGEHNFNDFPIEEISAVITQFYTTYGIELKDARILQLEYGVNLSALNYNVDDILQNIFFHKGIPFKWCETKTEGNYYQAKHHWFRIKIYDKSKQYRANYNLLKSDILRIEINYQGLQLRPTFNIITLSDLLNTPLNLLTQDLVERVSQILFYDFTIRINNASTLKYSNRNFWGNMIKTKRSSAFKKHRRKLEDITDKYSDNVQDYLLEKVREKCDQLTRGGTRIQSIHKGLIRVPQDSGGKVCPVTGAGISMQKEESKFLCLGGLRYYQNHNYNYYKSIEDTYLTKGYLKGRDRLLNVAHNIRDKYRNNPGKFNPDQLPLFNRVGN